MANPTVEKVRGLRSRDATRSTYLQVRTLVEHMQVQHRRLHEAYRSRQAEPDGRGGRTALLFAYCARREQDLESFLEQLSKRGRRGVLDTWIQYVDLAEYDRRVDEMIERPPEEPRDAVARLVGLDRELAGFYGQLEEKVSVPSCQQFFQGLRELTEERARQHAAGLPQAEDL